MSYAKLQGADLSYAQLQGANLEGAQLQGANLASAEVLLVNFPRDLPNQSPIPLGLAGLKMSPLTADTDWHDYVNKAKEREPSPDEIARFYADLACGDSGGHIANRMAERASIGLQDKFSKALASALLNANCKGAKALTDKTRATLEGLVSAAE